MTDILDNKEIKTEVEEVRKLFFDKYDSKKNHEFEMMLFGFNKKHLSYEKYMKVLEFSKKRSSLKKLKMETQETLDIVCQEDSSNFRITITGNEKINKYMKMLSNWKNHVIFNVLMTKIKEGSDKELIAMEKIKSKENTVDVSEYYLRFRLAEENDISKKEQERLSELDKEYLLKIAFRYKQRVSIYLDNDVRQDITLTRTTRNIKNLENIIPQYELEYEFVGDKPNNDSFETFFKEAILALKIIQQSNFVTSLSLEQKVRHEYARILSINEEKMQKLEGRKPESLEIQYVTESLPNNYAVTDKADGERCFLIIIDNRVYFIDSLLGVQDSGIEIKQDKYNDTILDGELIFLPSKNRHLFMAFDCLFKGREDVRKTQDFMKRIAHADEVVKECFVLGKQKGYSYPEYKNKKDYFDIEDIVNFHSREIKTFMDNINHDIEHEKKYVMVRRKYFIAAQGAKPWEIFRYSTLIWTKFTEDKDIKCPYMLDGLIYHPLQQSYTTDKKDSKFVEYKWKPPNKNSIDFYVTFEKDKDTGKVLNVYDNSMDEYVRNKPYRICNLFVGIMTRDGEKPIPFREEDEGSQTNLFMHGGEVRDLDGKLIADKTVVEFYYNNDPDIDPKFRWVPIRTRYDKTEMVARFGKQYGNYVTVANKVWRSITTPVLVSDFEELAKGNNEKKSSYDYDRKLVELRSKIGKELIVSASKENAYYQVKTNLGKEWRQWHNYIKSILMYTYINPMYQKGRQLSVLDLGYGRGGDTLKYYYLKISFLVAVEFNLQNLTNPLDGAISRYEEQRKRKANFPKMYFIHGDAGAQLNYEDQARSIGSMSLENKTLLEKFFSEDKSKKTKFDCINCQFAIHYMFKNEDTFKNLKDNIANHLKPGGYLLVTTYDGREVAKLLKDKDRHTEYYTNQKGEKKILWEIIKKYDKNPEDKFGVGYAIDFFGAWMFLEGNYETEYLIDPEFFEEKLANDCDLELVDSDMFINQYKKNEDFMLDCVEYEETGETRQFMENVRNFFTVKDDVNTGCMVMETFTRYYVFRKKNPIKTEKTTKMERTKTETKKDEKGESVKKTKIKLKGGGDSLEEILDDIYVAPENDYPTSVFNIIQTHKLIPKSETAESFYENLGFKLSKLQKIFTKAKDIDFYELNSKIEVSHEIKGKIKNMLKGINLYLIDVDGKEPVLKYYENSELGEEKNANVVIIKENNAYKPIYQTITGKTKLKMKKGLLEKSDEIIIKLDKLLV